MLYYMTNSGTYELLGDPVEISVTSAHEEAPQISLTDKNELTLVLSLGRKDKKMWGKVFQMPRYKVTEWMFPKKKKRGTKRRARMEADQ